MRERNRIVRNNKNMCAENQSKNQNELKGSEHNVSSVLAYVVLIICIVAMLCPLIAELTSRPTQKIEICLSVETDTLPAQKLEINKGNLDSLFLKIEEQERRLNERYDYALEQRENEFKWQTYITFIIGIIVSICGFFGYKSIRELKEEVLTETKQLAKTMATETAQATAESTARKIAEKVTEEEVKQQLPKQSKEYLNEHLQKEVSNQMENVFKSELYSALQKELMDYIDNKIEKKSQKKSKKASLEEGDEIKLPSDKEVEIMFQNIK